jgi:hypothetical protein
MVMGKNKIENNGLSKKQKVRTGILQVFAISEPD